ncbi:MAG TPA: hypothetical protein VN702_10715 [Acetobacteraceae bacterium]|nr:hypothetical protein [Acetobacteraceae bacterium]
MTTLCLDRLDVSQPHLMQPVPGLPRSPFGGQGRPHRPRNALKLRRNAATWRAVALGLTMGVAAAMLILPAIVGEHPTPPVVEAGSAARTQLPVPPPRRMEIYPDPIAAMNGALPVP